MKGWILTLASGREITVLELTEPYVYVDYRDSGNGGWVPESQADKRGKRNKFFDWKCSVMIEYVGAKKDLDAVKFLYEHYMRDPVVTELRVD